jgi:flagellar hook-associated protein 1 FlgK
MPAFSTLNTAMTGLTAAQRTMDVIAQNIVNSNTPGYSRQRVELSAIGAPPGASLFTGSKTPLGGVSVDGVTRIRTAFLEGTRATAGARFSALETRAGELGAVEQLLGEPGDTGLQSVLDDFFNSWYDLAQRPTAGEAGAVVIQRGQAVAQQLGFVANGTAERWNTARSDLANVLAQANQAASDLAGVNNRIGENLAAGRSANELMDLRDQLVRTLGELVGGTASPTRDGMVSVSVGGVDIVSGSTARSFGLGGATAVSEVGEDPPRITWNGIDVPVESGRAAGLLGVLATDFPAMMTSLDSVAEALATSVNTLHSAGYTLDGNPGGDFFSGSTALDLSVAVSEVDELAVSGSGGDVDGSTARRIGDLVDDRNAEAVLEGPGASALWRDLSAGLGVQVQSVERAVEVQRSVRDTADAAVESDAGVNLDEEMTSMLLFQRAYEASARVITVVDEMLDVLVNRTGMVGR